MPVAGGRMPVAGCWFRGRCRWVRHGKAAASVGSSSRPTSARRYHSAEEVVIRALETLAGKEPAGSSTRTMTTAEAVADIRDLRKGVTLGGLRIKDLINEGRKY